MKSRFSYNGTTTYENEIAIPDIQNTCLEVMDNKGFVSYMIMYTSDGHTIAVEAGPFVPDITALPDLTTITFSQYDASDYKSKKQISKFLQPKDKGKRKPVEVREINSCEACINIKMAFNINLDSLFNVFDAGLGSEDMVEDDEEEDQWQEQQ